MKKQARVAQLVAGRLAVQDIRVQIPPRAYYHEPTCLSVSHIIACVVYYKWWTVCGIPIATVYTKSCFHYHCVIVNIVKHVKTETNKDHLISKTLKNYLEVSLGKVEATQAEQHLMLQNAKFNVENV